MDCFVQTLTVLPVEGLHTKWNFNEGFTELYRFEIAALIEADNQAILA